MLAGFVEAGESLEQAIHREIGEEVDVSLSELHYFGSQPWPFPRSLMVGFSAERRDRHLRGRDEIGYADWFTRDELDGEARLPASSGCRERARSRPG